MWLLVEIWLNQHTLYTYAMPLWVSTLAWHICFIIPNKPQFGKIPMTTTMTAGRSSENGGRFAGGHFAGGHDGMANLCKPITAYDFHVRYNKTVYQTKLQFACNLSILYCMTKYDYCE